MAARAVLLVVLAVVVVGVVTVLPLAGGGGGGAMVRMSLGLRLQQQQQQEQPQRPHGKVPGRRPVSLPTTLAKVRPKMTRPPTHAPIAQIPAPKEAPNRDADEAPNASESGGRVPSQPSQDTFTKAGVNASVPGSTPFLGAEGDALGNLLAGSRAVPQAMRRGILFAGDSLLRNIARVMCNHFKFTDTCFGGIKMIQSAQLTAHSGAPFHFMWAPSAFYQQPTSRIKRGYAAAVMSMGVWVRPELMRERRAQDRQTLTIYELLHGKLGYGHLLSGRSSMGDAAGHEHESLGARRQGVGNQAILAADSYSLSREVRRREGPLLHGQRACARGQVQRNKRQARGQARPRPHRHP